MDIKADMNRTVSPQPAVQGEAVNAGKSNSVSAELAAVKEKAQDFAAMQEVMREALNVEPVADRELQIQFENELHIVVVKVLDKESGEVIRQIPMPEEISIAKGLRAAMRRMAGNQSGIVVDQEV
jgi:uncharacterized FlaG/YvyC family protein